MASIACLINLDDPTLTLDQQFPIVQSQHNMTKLAFSRVILDYDPENDIVPNVTLAFESSSHEEFTFSPTNYAITEIGREENPDTPLIPQDDSTVATSGDDETGTSGGGTTEAEPVEDETGDNSGGDNSGSGDSSTIPEAEPVEDDPIVIDDSGGDSGGDDAGGDDTGGDDTGGDDTGGDDSGDDSDLPIHYWLETYEFNLPRILTESSGVITLSVCYMWLDTVTENGVPRVIIDQEWHSLPAKLNVVATLHPYGIINQIDPSYVLEYDKTGTIAYLTPDTT